MSHSIKKAVEGILKEEHVQPNKIDPITNKIDHVIENKNLVCNSCGCIGKVTTTYDKTPHIRNWIAHIECPGGMCRHVSEGIANTRDDAIRRTINHWKKYS